jgi:sulfur relay (sulfurtransferase) complex TusBCD TusD component (DsrE family)
MNVLVILNDPAYGTERAYNALRLAGSLAKRDGVDVRVFCLVTRSPARSQASMSPTATTTSTA